MKKYFFLCSLFFVVGCASLPSRYVSLDDQKTDSLDSVFGKIEKDRVIFIGELHDNPAIHLLQLEIIRRLHESGKPVMVAVEAFPAGKQDILDRWIAGDLREHDFQRAYGEIWSVPYDYYKGILLYARHQKIPLVAINADNALIGTVSKNGMHGVPENFLRQVKFTDCSTDPLYTEILGKTHHASEFPFLCDGQRLRDSVMAYNIANAMKGNNDTVVVLVGATHAIRPAVPRILQSHIAARYTILLPESVRRVIRRVPDRNIADYIWYE